MGSPYAIEMLNITKRFPGIIANDNITLQLKKGEIHALLGENGAGKSTLMSVLFGLYQPEEGVIKKDGQVVSIKDPNDANALGIGMVHQHFKLVECFTVLDNIIMGVEPTKHGFLQKAEAREKVLALSEKYGLHVDPDAKVEDISVGMQQRVEILKVHAKDVHLDESVDLDAIALATSGAVGADLANMINEAAIMAVQHGREYVSQKDLFAAVEQVLVGKEKKDRIMSREERKIVSYHEVGHALISALQKNSEPVQKITIVPRTMGALGYVMQVPEEEKYLNTEAELRDMLVGLVGGRAAEEVVFDTVTTGAANDIEKATSIARNMITRYGMSKDFDMVAMETVTNQYLGGDSSLTCSMETQTAIDREVVELVKKQHEKAGQILLENRAKLDELSQYLYEKETITGEEFMKILNS